MDLSQRMEFCQSLLYFFENFVLVQEPLKKSRFDVPTTQSVRVLFEGAFSL